VAIQVRVSLFKAQCTGTHTEAVFQINDSQKYSISDAWVGERILARSVFPIGLYNLHMLASGRISAGHRLAAPRTQTVLRLISDRTAPKRLHRALSLSSLTDLPACWWKGSTDCLGIGTLVLTTLLAMEGCKIFPKRSYFIPQGPLNFAVLRVFF
jgi:hypothetical protein